MLVRFTGEADDVDGAAGELRSALADMAADPSTAALREAWERSPAWTATQ
jgi:hypothetical protein